MPNLSRDGKSGSERFAERQRLQPFVPPGWRVVDVRICGCERDAFVLCEKSDDRVHDTQFVTWEVDLKHGGCYHGRYTEDRAEGLASLEDRYRRHA